MPISSADRHPAAMPRAATLAKLVALLALAGFEILVAVLALRPRVSEAYRRHYIARTSACWVDPESRRRVLLPPIPRTIRPGDLDQRVGCVYLPDGWAAVDPWGVWTLGQTATILVPVDASTTRAVLSVTAPEYLPGPQDFVIAKGGREIYSGSVMPKATLDVTLPVGRAEADQDGLVRLDLRILHPLSPRRGAAGDDWRALGLGLLSIQTM